MCILKLRSSPRGISFSLTRKLTVIGSVSLGSRLGVESIAVLEEILANRTFLNNGKKGSSGQQKLGERLLTSIFDGKMFLFPRWWPLWMIFTLWTRSSSFKIGFLLSKIDVSSYMNLIKYLIKLINPPTDCDVTYSKALDWSLRPFTRHLIQIIKKNHSSKWISISLPVKLGHM